MISVLELDPRRLRGRTFRLEELAENGGRIAWREEPRPGAVYSLGADMAYGLEGRDYDAAVVLRVGKPCVQVAEAHGHWGPRFDRVLYALARHFNDAFVVGERQVGLFALSSLFHEFGYTNLYGDRDETKTSRKALKSLGYHRPSADTDVTMPKLRRAIIEGSCLILSDETLAQMSAYQFRPRSGVSLEEATDSDLKCKLVTGGSPDLIMAAAYAFHGCEEVQWVEEEPKGYGRGTMGDIMDHDAIFEPGEEEEKPRRGGRRR